MILTDKIDAFFLVSGASEGFTELNSFDGALLDAGIGNTNLVKMSSIVPPGCIKIDPHTLKPGSLVPVAYAHITSDVPGELISAAVAVAMPEDENLPGLIMEYSARGRKDTIENIVRNMVEEGFKMRGWKMKSIDSVSVEFEVKRIATAFAAVVLTNREMTNAR